MPKMTPTSQAPSKAGSNTVKYAVGSGSRPTGSKLVIPSSAPKSAKNHKG